MSRQAMFGLGLTSFLRLGLAPLGSTAAQCHRLLACTSRLEHGLIITDYQHEFPFQPVHLIGHSGGAGIALFALDQLPAGHSVTSVTLMAAAVSRKFDVTRLLQRTRFGIWNFFSPFDLPTMLISPIRRDVSCQ